MSSKLPSSYRTLLPFKRPSVLSRFVFLLLSLSCFTSTLSAQALQNWSDPATWDSGSVPSAGETVVIPAGKRVRLDVSPPLLQGIHVYGQLLLDADTLDLRVGHILVMGGMLQAGTEGTPYDGLATITFVGDTVDVTGMGLGNKFLMVMGGGQLELHGSRRNDLSWTVLRKNAMPGSAVIETEAPSNWRIGDQIVIAPSGTKGVRAEQRTITDIMDHSIRLDAPLQHTHVGSIDTVEGVALDMRAEVGLLTRNIVLQGDNGSNSSQNGGHVMIMNGSSARVEGVEFFRMGWFGKAGRYPIHWHFSGTSYGEYARNNSIHRSFHRGIVVHGTSGVTANDNVAYDVFSHCFVLAEDGNEFDNVFERNLGVLTRRIPNNADFAFPGTFASSQSEMHPGTFWLTNPNNILRDNRAAGGEGAIGFFYDGNGTASSVPNNFFTGNVAHSYTSLDGGYDRAFYRSQGWGLFVGPGMGEETPLIFKDFFAYKNTLGGAWLEGYGVTLQDAVLAEGGTGANVHASTLNRVTIVRGSKNRLSSSNKNYGAINIFSSFEHGTKEPKLLDVTIINHNIGILMEAPELDEMSVVRELDFINQTGPQIRITEPDMQGAIVDLQGNLNVYGQPAVMFGADYPFTLDDCLRDSSATALVCPLRGYAFLEVESPSYTAGPVGYMDIERLNGSAGTDMFDARIIDTWLPEYGHRQTQWINVGKDYRLRFNTDPMPAQWRLTLNGYRPSHQFIEVEVPTGYRPVVRTETGSPIPQSDSDSTMPTNTDSWYFNAATRTLTMGVHLDGSEDFRTQLSVSLVSLRTAEASPSVKVFPNPAQDHFQVEFMVEQDGTQSDLMLWSSDGQLVYHHPQLSLNRGPHRIAVPGERLADGWYRYTLRVGDKRKTGTVQILRP
jgi:hypothetical protein